MGWFDRRKEIQTGAAKESKEFSYGELDEDNDPKKESESDDSEFADEDKDKDDVLEDIYGDIDGVSKNRKVKDDDNYDGFDLKLWELAVIIIEIILFIYTILVLLNVVPLV